MVEPQTAGQPLVLGVRVTQLGVGLAIGRQPDVLAQPARLLDQVHVGHHLRRHLAEPLGVDGGHRHTDEEDEDLQVGRGRRGIKRREDSSTLELRLDDNTTKTWISKF